MSSYSRFVERYPRAILPMVALLHTCMASCEGASFVDSTPLRVYNNHRIYCHKVFADSAARGKTSMGWFFGFKLHLAINHKANCLTTGNTDDREGLEKRAHPLFELFFADKRSGQNAAEEAGRRGEYPLDSRYEERDEEQT